MFFFNFKPSSKNSRDKLDKFWNRTNTVLLIGYLITLPICTLITLSSIFPLLTASLLTSIKSSHYSTSIPWIDDASECQYSGRSWRDRKCWDDQHNPMF